jgi:non-lysosomal glucosylceramidase
MSSLRRFNRRTFLGTTAAAAAGAGTVGLVQISGAQQETAAKAQYTSPAGNAIPFSRTDLYAHNSARIFEGPHLSEIAFPLGGIGTGTVSLGGRGNRRDWEILSHASSIWSRPICW